MECCRQVKVLDTSLTSSDDDDDDDDGTAAAAASPAPKKRGHPSKAAAAATPASGKKRGRPSKADPAHRAEEAGGASAAKPAKAAAAASGKKRGRPSKVDLARRAGLPTPAKVSRKANDNTRYMVRFPNSLLLPNVREGGGGQEHLLPFVQLLQGQVPCCIDAND